MSTKQTEHGKWCPRCGCGNDVAGYRHLNGCSNEKDSKPFKQAYAQGQLFAPEPKKQEQEQISLEAAA